MSGLLRFSFAVSRAGLFIAGTDNQGSDESNQQYNSNFFHMENIILDYKNKLFILNTIFIPEILISDFYSSMNA
jgi:hypothetical protein